MKLFMMPHTVPNRPTKGAVEPMVASSPVPLFMSRAAAASRRARRDATRSLMPSRSVRSEDSRNSCAAAAMNDATMPRPVPTRSAAAASDRSSPMAASAMRKLRRAKNSSMLLASHTVQVTTEAKAKPTITDCTMMSAEANIDHGERSRGSCRAPMSPGVGSAEGGTGCWDGAWAPAWPLSASISATQIAPIGKALLQRRMPADPFTFLSVMLTAHYCGFAIPCLCAQCVSQQSGSSRQSKRDTGSRPGPIANEIVVDAGRSVRPGPSTDPIGSAGLRAGSSPEAHCLDPRDFRPKAIRGSNASERVSPVGITDCDAARRQAKPPGPAPQTLTSSNCLLS